MSALRIDVVEDDRALGGLDADWNRLLGETPGASGFQSFAWASACRAVLSSPGRRLLTLVLRDGAETVAIVPTELAPGGTLGLVGEEVSNYLGPVYRAARLDEIVHALGGFIAAERRVALLDFRGLRESSPFLEAFGRLRLPGWTTLRMIATATCPYVDLSGGWGAVYGARKSRQRSNFARKWKALERLGQAEFSEVVGPDGVQPALATMFALFAERWAGRHESGGFAGGFRRFHERAAPQLAAAGHVRLSLLTLDGEIVAYSYGIRAASVTSSYVLAHANALNVCSPGALLLVRMLEAACQRGDPEYDFSLGEESYKEVWATGTRRVFRLLGWRRWSPAAVRGRARDIGGRAWVAARSVEWLRDVRREGLGHVLRRAPTPDVRQGVAAHVYRLTDGTGTRRVVCEPSSYASLSRYLSRPALALAVDRSFRGDVALAVVRDGRVLGVVWRAHGARRQLVTGGLELPPEEVVYYDPVPVAGASLEEVVDALAASAEASREVIVVTPEPLAGAAARHVATFVVGDRPRSED